jgi:hypothetical protein
VFVDGATTDVRALADAMAQRYGLPADDLFARLSRGRFRVKANVDLPTAQTYQRDLEALGARVTLEAANPLDPPSERGARTSVLPPRASAASIQPPNAARTSTKPGMTSGLSAAFTGEPPASASLGALEKADGRAFSLASLDGQEDSRPSGNFGPPPDAHAPVATGGADAFRPPDADAAEQLISLAPDEEAHRARKRVSTPPAIQAVPEPGGPPQRRSSPSIPASDARRSSPSIPAQPERRTPSAHPPLAATSAAAAPDPASRAKRIHFALGVLISIAVGFVPAHFVSSMREKSVYASIDEQVEATQSAADTPEAYAGLDELRATQLDIKRDARRNIVFTALGVWAVVGGAAAFAWFRRRRA